MSGTPKIAVLCDGSWCGRETDTRGNVLLLAEMIGIKMSPSTGPDIHILNQPSRPGIKARYANGVGLGSTFLAYLFNGGTGEDIADQCKNAYQFIVENYTGNEEIWMFGLSRGAFTVRCVGGMINNCGIVKPVKHSDGSIHEEETDTLCEEVYRIYRSPYECDSPQSDQMKAFRERASHHVKTPVKFMGLFDTVGSLGIPHFTGGIGFDWPEFYDQKVSSVVEKVYHAMSIHDRIWAFEPCMALRDPQTQASNPNLEIEQKWFPGVHYDLGRQRFRFFRAGLPGYEGFFARILNLFSGTIEPNHVLSDLVLKWMLECIKKHDPDDTLIPGWETEYDKIIKRINEAPQKGSGDVYGHALDYVPFGKVINLTSRGFLARAISSLLDVQFILQILFAVTDRRIPDRDAKVYDYKKRDPTLGTVKSIETLAGLDERRYPSRTFETFRLFLLAGGWIDRREYARTRLNASA